MKPLKYSESQAAKAQEEKRKELIIENNTVYEIDLACIENKQKKNKGYRH